MTSPYYTGDAVPLKFTVTDKDGAVNPSLAMVYILMPGNRVSNGVEATIDGNEVSYTVPSDITQRYGKYKAYFVCTLTYGERTHKIEFSVRKNPGG